MVVLQESHNSSLSAFLVLESGICVLVDRQTAQTHSTRVFLTPELVKNTRTATRGGGEQLADHAVVAMLCGAVLIAIDILFQ